MNLYILPTRDLLRLFSSYENLFWFYNDGVKGVIRDIILFSNAWELKHYSPIKDCKKPITAQLIFDKIVQEYSNSPDGRMNGITGNLIDSECVEIAAELIDNAVSDMMFVLFSSLIYDVSKTNWKWFGDDIIVEIKIFT